MNFDDYRDYQFGDSIDQLMVTESLKTCTLGQEIGELDLQSEDLVVKNTLNKSQMSTVHS